MSTGAPTGCDSAPKDDDSKRFVRGFRAAVLNPHCGDAKKAAETIVDADPQLAGHEDLREEVGLLLSEDEGEYLFKS